jgi:hypothetical protein
VARWALSIDNWASGMAHTAPNSSNPEIANAPEWTPSGTEHTSWYRHPSIYSHAEPRTRLGLVMTTGVRHFGVMMFKRGRRTIT